MKTLNALAAAAALISLCALPGCGWGAAMALVISVMLFVVSEHHLPLPFSKPGSPGEDETEWP